MRHGPSSSGGRCEPQGPSDHFHPLVSLLRSAGCILAIARLSLRVFASSREIILTRSREDAKRSVATSWPSAAPTVRTPPATPPIPPPLSPPPPHSFSS